MSDRHIRRSGDDYRDAFLELLPQGQAWPKHAVDSVLWQACDGLNNYWGFVDGRAADLLERESDPRQTIELLPDWERNWGLPDPCYTAPQTVAARREALVQRMTMLGAQSRQWYIDFAKFLGYDITISEYRTFVCGIDRCGDNRVYGDPNGPKPYYNSMFVSGWLPVCDPLGQLLGGPPGTAGTMSAVGKAPGGANRAVGYSGTVPVGRTSGKSTADATGSNTTPALVLSEYPNYGLGPPENRYYWTVHVSATTLMWFRCASGQCGVDPHLRIGIPTDLQCILNRWKPAHTQIIYDLGGLTNPNDPMAGTP